MRVRAFCCAIRGPRPAAVAPGYTGEHAAGDPTRHARPALAVIYSQGRGLHRSHHGIRKIRGFFLPPAAGHVPFRWKAERKNAERKAIFKIARGRAV
jgi:hypothetical protein